MVPFPVPPGKTYSPPDAHAKARSDLDTSASLCGIPAVIPCAPLSEYYVNSAIVAHENDHVAHFYSSSFPFWDSQMNLFQSVDVEDPGVFVIYNCTDPNTTSAAAAIATKRPAWDAAITDKHKTADGLERPTSEAHAYGVENPIENAVRATIPIP